MSSDPYASMIEDMKKDKEKGSGSRKFWNFDSKEEGTKSIRFLPPLVNKGEKFFYYSHKTHWIDGKSFECLDQNTQGHQAEACPVCKVVQKLYKTAEKGTPDWELAGSLRAKDRKVSRIVLRGSDDETQPVFYEYGSTIFDMLFNIITDSDFGNIVHPLSGRDYKLTKTGVGRNCKYGSSTPSAKETPIFTEKEKIGQLLKNCENMNYTDLFTYPTAQEMADAINEFLNGDDEGAEVVRHPEPAKAASSSVPKATKPVVEEDDEESDEDSLDEVLKQFQL